VNNGRVFLGEVFEAVKSFGRLAGAVNCGIGGWGRARANVAWDEGSPIKLNRAI
jgi:hypothetical protein